MPLSAAEVERDLRPFADPATEFELQQSANDIRVKLVRDGHGLELLLNRATAEVKARHDYDRVYTSLTSLLASSDFANIRWLAQTQRRMYGDFSTRTWIRSEGLIIDDNDPTGKKLSDEGLKRLLASPKSLRNQESTKQLSIVLIDGPAGIGKTTLIQRLASDRSMGYERSSSDPPLLHVTSRGRRLTNLSDALAHAAQSLRAKFTFDQIPVLVRHGLLQIAIDGFDELVDADGYKDAWYALQSFFEDVGFGGPILLAGRDTFFDQHGFLERLGRVKDRINLSQVHLSNVSLELARAYLMTSGWQQEEIDGASSPLKSDAYILRPFFLTSIAHLKTWEAFQPPNETIRGFLIDLLITRESKFITEIAAVSEGQAKALLTQVFSEAALEMGDNESDNIDIELVSFLAEIAFADLLDASDTAKLSNKAGSFAAFEPDQRTGRVRFRHSEILHYFTSVGIISQISRGEFPRFIRRGVIGTDLQEAFSDVFLTTETALARAFVEQLSLSLTRFSEEGFLGNLVALLLATSCRGDNIQRTAKYALVNEIRLPDVVATTTLRSVTMNVLDVRGSDVSKVTFEDCDAARVIADKRTVFGKSTPLIHALQLDDAAVNGIPYVLFDRTEISDWIDQSTRPEQHNRGTQYPFNDAGELLDRVCRRASRQYFLKDSEEDPGGVLMRDKRWPILKEILDAENRLKYRRDVQASGPGGLYVHVVDASTLLDPDSSLSARRIWDKIQSLTSQF